MAFQSILFPDSVESSRNTSAAPDYFGDLGLDDVVRAVLTGLDGVDVAPVFWTPLYNLDVIRYRQDVMDDLQASRHREPVSAFAADVRAIHQQRARSAQLTNTHARARTFVSVVDRYGRAVRRLSMCLAATEPRSQGLEGLRQYLSAYVASDTFTAMTAQAAALDSAASEVSYTVLIDGNTVSVRDDRGGQDYSVAIEETFAKFRGNATKSYLVRVPQIDFMNHVEEQILDRVALLHADLFNELAAFSARYDAFADPVLDRFYTEVHFYLSYLSFVERLRSTGLPLCRPVVSQEKTLDIHGLFDIALATGLLSDAEPRPIVLNDIELRQNERLLVITGPNQGGKTTLARALGQIHHLAALGCLVPGTKAHVLLCDRVFTHFERQERVATLHGKLEEDLIRIREILEQATPASLIILNEIFSSTTLRDALVLSQNILKRISTLDAVAVCVTFLDELATLNDRTVSLVATVAPDDVLTRTFKVERRPANGFAYAMAIAEKYHLTREQLAQRLIT